MDLENIICRKNGKKNAGILKMHGENEQMKKFQLYIKHIH